MQIRALGRSGLSVSALGLGCMGISFSYATKLSKDDGIALIREARAKGALPQRCSAGATGDARVGIALLEGEEAGTAPGRGRRSAVCAVGSGKGEEGELLGASGCRGGGMSA